LEHHKIAKPEVTLRTTHPIFRAHYTPYVHVNLWAIIVLVQSSLTFGAIGFGQTFLPITYRDVGCKDLSTLVRLKVLGAMPLWRPIEIAAIPGH
jgi:hypothetical protein